MTANVLASSADFLEVEDALRSLPSRCVGGGGGGRSVDTVGRHTAKRKNAKERRTADAQEDTTTMRCVVQNVESTATGASGSGGGGDGSGGGGGGGVDGRGMEGGGVVGDGGGRGGGGFGLGDAGGRGDCATTPATKNGRTSHFISDGSGGIKKRVPVSERTVHQLLETSVKGA